MLRLQLFMALLAALAPAGHTDHHMIELGSLGGAFSQARAINDRGEIVGNSATGNGTHAFVWKDGRMTDLGTLGGRHSSANGINNRGEVVGSSTTVDGSNHASGRATPLGEGYALAVNDRGQVVVDYSGVWHRGHFTPIQGARAINNHGTVAGSAEPGAFVWNPGRTSILPRAAGDTMSFAAGINDRGQVAGFSGAEEGRMRAVLWTR